MYVINPDSYNLCATCITCFTPRPKRLEASCWSDEVINGAAGFFFHCLITISCNTNHCECFCETILYPVFSSACTSLSLNAIPYSLHAATTSSYVANLGSFQAIFARVTWSVCVQYDISANSFQDSSGLNHWISLSFSIINFTATDCTRHADNPRLILVHNTGEIENHTSLSNTRRACCASTKSILSVLGFCTACCIASFVISWNTIRGVVFTSNHNACATCQPIASHSRSSSVANHTPSASFTCFLSSAITFLFSGVTSYVGSKSFLISIHIVLAGKSDTCPYDALTVTCFPKYPEIVLAFAGDSTITRWFHFDMSVDKSFFNTFTFAGIFGCTSFVPLRSTLRVDFFAGDFLAGVFFFFSSHFSVIFAFFAFAALVAQRVVFVVTII